MQNWFDSDNICGYNQIFSNQLQKKNKNKQQQDTNH